MIGKVISHYNIIKKISEGGMGVVYQAEDLKLNRIVAMKFLPSNLTRSTSQKDRFVNEAKALATLNHPNVATIFGIEESEANSFIVMEYVEGLDLRRVLVENGSESGLYHMPIEKIIETTTQIVQGVRAAHQKQIIHRDIKPENIMINDDGLVKILDFGLAKIVGTEQLTKINVPMGTTAYMSPEQIYGKNVDKRTDIWSLGVVLYELITGTRPFKGDYEQAIFYSILNESPAPVETFRQEVPKNLVNIVYKALAKNPEDRYKNCEELLKDLESLPSYRQKDHINKQVIIKKNDPHIIPLNKKNRNIKWYALSVKKRIRISWMIILAILIFSVTGLYIFTHMFQNNKSYGKKIAVLPFINLSHNINDEYFSDGIMEDILTQLVKISDLKVISRTTMMHYKNSNKNLREISNELNANVVLEGSIRHYANKLRIAVQLIDARTDEHLWAETYDRSINDIFEVQSQIAFQIASTLNVEFSKNEKENLDKPSTTNPEAYNAYLQGRFFLEQRTREDVEKAITYFEQAIQFYPDYALAWIGLSQAHTVQADIGTIPVDKGYNLAKIEAEKALKIDPKLAEGYARLAWIKMTYDWDWNGADYDYKRAMKLEPGNAAIIQSAGVLAAVLGRMEEAIALSLLAIELNPILSTPNYNLGLHYYYNHQWEKAKTAVRRALELNPQYPAAYVLLGRIYIAESKPKEALLQMKNETEITWRKFGLILAYHALDMKKEEEKALSEFIKEYQYVSAFQIAEIYSFRGDLDKTFYWLERAFQQRDGGLGDMKGDPLLDNIVNDSRYSVFMKKMRL